MNVVIFIELAIYFYCIYVVLKRFYGYIPKTNSIVYIPLILYILLAIISVFLSMQIPYVLAIFGAITNIILLKYIFNTAKSRSIICSFLCLYSLNITFSSIILFLINNRSNLVLNETISLIIDFLLLIIFFIVNITPKSNINTKFSLIPLSVKRITLLSLFLSSFIVSLLSDYSAVKDINKWGISIRIILSLLVIVLGSAFPIMIANSIGKSFYTEQSKKFEHQIQTQAVYYENLSKSNYELRRFRHDYKNMRIGVTKYIHDGNIEEAENMLNNCDSLLKQATQSLIKFDTGNGIVDAILTEKQEKATTVNTVITFDGAIAESAITATDLCVIFGNTLDNAIEACGKLQTNIEKVISIVCKCNSGFMFLTITNPVAENIKIHNNTIQTTKQDKSNHGFGLYSLQKIVDKYDGTITLSCENELFKCEVALNV